MSSSVNLLGKYYKYITRSDKDEISLDEEISYAKTYTKIQEIRFSQRIKVVFEDLIGEYSKNIMVPRLIIQPLIENAFKYGLKNKISSGLLNAHFTLEKSILNFCVEDNGDINDDQLAALRAKMQDYSNVETTGLINIQKRIKLNFGQDSGIEIDRSSLDGLKVNIRIILNDKRY